MQHITSQYVLRTRSSHLLTTFTQFPHPGTPTPSNHKSGFWVCYRLHTQSDITQYLSLCMTYFTWQNAFKVHPCCYKCQEFLYFIFFMTEEYSTVSHIFFIHWSVDGHLGCFHIFVIVNHAAITREVQIALPQSDFFPSYIYSEVELLDGKDLFLNFWGTSTLSS